MKKRPTKPLQSKFITQLWKRAHLQNKARFKSAQEGIEDEIVNSMANGIYWCEYPMINTCIDFSIEQWLKKNGCKVIRKDGKLIIRW